MKDLSCAEARDMACELIDGDLAAVDRANLEAHVADCITCPNVYRALVAVTTKPARQRSIESGDV